MPMNAILKAISLSVMLFRLHHLRLTFALNGMMKTIQKHHGQRFWDFKKLIIN